MQGVAELVEQGGDFVNGEQVGADRHDVDHHRLRPGEVGLVHKRAHPGAAALGRAGVVVGEQQPDAGAVFFLDLPHIHVLAVAGEVGALLHRDAVEQVRGVKNAVGEHLLEREVLAQLRLVDAELLLAALGLPVRPVRAAELLAGQFAGEFALGLGVRGRRRRQVGDELARCRGGAGGLLRDDVVGVRVKAEQPRTLLAQTNRLQHDARVGVLAAGTGGVEKLVARGRFLELRLQRLGGGQLDRHHVAPAVLVGGELVVGEPREFFAGELHRELLRVRQ